MIGHCSLLLASLMIESLVEKGAEELILTFLYISPDEVKVLSALKFRTATTLQHPKLVIS